MKKIYALLVAGISFSAMAQDPQMNSWDFNLDGVTASYYKKSPGPGGGTLTTVAVSDSSDIKALYYNTETIYVTSEGLSSHIMGPWSIPNVPSAQGYIFMMPRTPAKETGTKTSVPEGGSVGFAVDGIPIFGYESAESWSNNQGTVSFSGDGIWNADAWVTEGETMDTTLAAHAQQTGGYHYHATPINLYDVSNTTAHSPIVGWAPDGYPIYGPYGYTDSLAASTVTRMVSGYAKRDITVRHRLPGASSDLSTNEQGPDVSNTYPVGYFVEDYEYVAGSGSLDEYNGRWCVTPEYPSGTYAYFITIDGDGEPAHPYVFADEYYGVGSNSGVGRAAVPAGVTQYDPLTTSTTEWLELNGVSVYPNPMMAAGGKPLSIKGPR